ncbi:MULTISPECIES: hypothetical protein [Mesobacillus]|uniref:Sodium:solute symporter family permease YidK n=1 Tax=Mesobacillus stamsii TaxID=225347 RepID=A0ABU0FW15_9BACI|nr:MULTISPECIES: hypothetical protein [Mesobacillus]MDQ0414015.1 putative sodium:solute symporter family permease YidK [Mesobacillus stamsii]
MSYVFTFIVLFVVFYLIMKVTRSRNFPSNDYTPFDNLTEGKKKDD